MDNDDVGDGRAILSGVAPSVGVVRLPSGRRVVPRPREDLDEGYPLYPNSWLKAEHNVLITGLMRYGYGRWSKIQATGDGRLRRRSINELICASRMLMVRCFIHTPGSVERAALDALLREDLPPGLSAAAQNQVLSGEFVAAEAFVDGMEKRKFVRWARKLRFLRQLQSVTRDDLLSALARGDLRVPAQLPAAGWGGIADRDLVLGNYEHGYGNSRGLLDDRNLCFHRLRPEGAREEVVDWRWFLERVPPLAHLSEAVVHNAFSQLMAESRHAVNGQDEGMSGQIEALLAVPTYRQNVPYAPLYDDVPPDIAELVGLDRGEGDVQGGVFNLTAARGARVLERVSLFYFLRLTVLPHRGLAQVLRGMKRWRDLPLWWRSLHDRALLWGVDRHGVNGWAALWVDPELGFGRARAEWLAAHPDDGAAAALPRLCVAMDRVHALIAFFRAALDAILS
eukprot:contig_5466_g1240